MQPESLEASAAHSWCTTHSCPHSARICGEIRAATEETIHQFQVCFRNTPPQICLY